MEDEWTKEQYFKLLQEKLMEIINAINMNLWPNGASLNLLKDIPTGLEPGEPMIDYPLLRWLPG